MFHRIRKRFLHNAVEMQIVVFGQKRSVRAVKNRKAKVNRAVFGKLRAQILEIFRKIALGDVGRRKMIAHRPHLQHRFFKKRGNFF